MKKIDLYYKLLTIGLLFFVFISNISGSDKLKLSCDAVSNGNVDKLISNCSELIMDEDNFEQSSKAYALLSFGYLLKNGSDVEDRIFGLLDLMSDKVAKSSSGSIVSFLSGELKKESFLQKKKQFKPEWQELSLVALYLNGVKKGEKVQDLYKYYQEYKKNIVGLPNASFALCWRSRLPKWQMWIQSGKGKKNKLEKLIADSSPSKKRNTSRENKAEKIEAISVVIREYLNNNADKAKKLAKTTKESYSDKDDSLYSLLDYLSGNKSISTDDLMSQNKKNASNWSISTIAMFAKTLSDSAVVDKFKLYFYIDNYLANYNIIKGKKEIADWKPRVDVWKRWCDNNLKTDGLEIEPLLMAKSKKGKGNTIAVNTETANETTLDITTVELKDFEEGRDEIYKKRPRPASMTFDDDKFKKYLLSLPEKLQKAEKLRYQTVKGIKHYLTRVLERSPFPKGIYLKGKGKKNGVIYMANENGLRFKKSTKSKKGKTYKWDQLAFAQYPACLSFYAKRRLGISAVGRTSKKKIKRDAANDYLALAIVCDWFGDYKKSLKYAKIAVKTYPKFKNSVSRLMLE